VLVNERTIVRSLVSKEQMQQAEMEDFVERTFEGSVPSFVAAFAKFKKISQTEIDQLQEMIDSYRKGEDIG
jgi:predicted transcriptional regulator